MKHDWRQHALGILAACLLLACERNATDTVEEAFHRESYWVGTIEVEGLTWQLGIEPRRDAPPVVDLASLWRARQEATSYTVRDDGSLELGLPESLGSLVIERRDGNRLVGSVARPDGAQGTYRASPGTWVSAEVAEFRVHRDDVEIATSLLTPTGDGPFPAIVVVHGSGDSDRSVPPYRFLGQYFVQRGFAVALYDKRGNGESTGDWRTVGFDARAQDVGAIVERLALHEAIDPQAIGLIGISQGVWVGGLAARHNPRVAFMIAVSGPAVPPARSDGYAGWVQSRQAGLTVEEADARRDLGFLYLDAIRDPASDAAWRRFSAALDDAKQQAWFDKRPLVPRPRAELHQGWYPRVMDHDPVPVLEVLDIPVLWLYGERDTQLNARESVAILERLQASGKDYEIHLFPNAGHGIAVPVDAAWASPDYTTSAPEFFETIDRFVRTRTRP